MSSLKHFEAVAGALALPGLAVIDGELRPALSGATFDNIGPRNGATSNRAAAGDERDIDAAVAAARKAFDDGRWRHLHYREKKRILFRLAELMERTSKPSPCSKASTSASRFLTRSAAIS